MTETLSKFFRELVYIQQGQPGKPFFRSKRFWVFAISAVAIPVQARFGWVIDPEVQLGLLAVVNFIVGLLTKSPTGFAWEDQAEGAQAGTPAPSTQPPDQGQAS